MVDFTKLLDLTPEHRQAVLDEAQRAFEDQNRAQLEDRSRQIAQALRAPNLTERERGFVEQLQQLAERSAGGDRKAGLRLLEISDAQRRWLAAIASRAATTDRVAKRPGEPPDIFARIRRFSAAARGSLPRDAADPECGEQDAVRARP